jgi:hypothetical protein
MAINPNVLQNITVPNEETDLYQINDDNQNISNQSIDLPPSALTFKNNIAPTKNNDSAEPVKNFFDRYFVEPISLPAGDVDAVIGFFEKRKFDKTAAMSVSTILLQQAKLDNVDVFRLLDTLKGITDVQLSNVVTEILNVNRSKISTLGFKVENTQNQFEKRNIVV